MKKIVALGLKLALFNLLIVSVWGFLMRYKIAFELDYFVQKHLLEAHSHFAFYGWITTALFILLIRFLKDKVPNLKVWKYYLVTIVNLLGAYAVFVSYTWTGYTFTSIILPMIPLLCDLAFLILIIQDLHKVKTISGKWFIGGLFFAFLSTFGVLALVYMYAGGRIPQHMLLSTDYYYLHFQYNGFFIFACIGLLLYTLEKMGASISHRLNNIMFWSMFVGCILGYGLSILWMDLPVWVFVLIVIGSVVQTYGVWLLFAWVWKNWFIIKSHWTRLQRFVLIYVGLAFAVKILLQLGSNIPAVNQFAFGFRNIVIAYLHLILLMAISTFLIILILYSGLYKVSKAVIWGIYLFLTGVFLNEFFLGINGILSIKYIIIPYTQYILLGITALIVLGILIMVSPLRLAEEQLEL